MDDQYEQCGVGCFKPRALRCCANMAAFVTFYSPAVLCTSAITMYMSSQITTLEKYFGFNSSQTGFLLSCNDIGFLLITILIANFARKVHIPRVLSCATLLYGFSGVFVSLAYFLSPGTTFKKNPGQNTTMDIGMYSQSKKQLCLSIKPNLNDSCETIENDTDSKVGVPTTFTNIAIAIIAIGMIVQGFGKSPRQPYVTTYIDDNVPKHKTGCYIGITLSAGIFGPAVGFGLGAVFSRMYVTLEKVSITIRDPRWVGAWWLGFIVFGILAIIVALPLLCFPKHMNQNGRKKDIDQQQFSSEKKTILDSIKEFGKALWRILTNARFILNLMSVCLGLFFVAGFVAFTPKYLETQFNVPTWKANMLVGVVAVFSASFGTLIGGFITTYKKLSPIACLKLTIVCHIIIVIPLFLGFFLGCSNPKIQGFPHSDITLNSTCMESCNCDNVDYFPVCGSDGINYKTPCHAGCQDTLSDIGTVYTNCSCVQRGNTATPGLCDSDCKMLGPFMVVVFIAAFVSSVGTIPSIIFSVRCVKDEDKSLAVGVSSFLQTLLGWMLGPVVAGKIIDTCCVLWNSSCYGTGSCAMYDIEDFRFKKHIVDIIFRIVIIVLKSICFLISRNRTDWSTEERAKENIAVPTPEKQNLIFEAKNDSVRLFAINDPIVKKT